MWPRGSPLHVLPTYEAKNGERPAPSNLYDELMGHNLQVSIVGKNCDNF